MKKIIAWLLVIVLTAGAAIGGTLAYLTDRDSEANVFTVGDVSINLNEKFEQGAELIPGVRIEKEATITNTGKNDAWVWMTVAVPAVLDDENAELGSANVLHWNMPGCFWNGYHNKDKYIQSGIKDGYLPEGSTGVADEDSWINDNKAVKETINGIEYNVYTFKYVGAIVPGETTNIGLSRVFLDENLDIDPDGQWYIVENGTATKVNWNSNANGNPVVYVSAYAMQAEGFETVQEAYDAYQTQWGENGTEFGAIIVHNAEELNDTLAKYTDVTIALANDIEIDKVNLTNAAAGDVTIIANGHTFSILDSDEGIRSVHVGGADRNITIVGANIVCKDVTTSSSSDVRGVSFNRNSSGSTVSLIDCTIDLADDKWSKGINVISGITNATVNIEGCSIRASEPVKIFCDDSIFNISDSTFICTASLFSEDNWYAQCIRLQDGSSNNVVNVSNCEFDYQGSLEEVKVYAILDTGTGNTVNVSDCTYSSSIDVEFYKGKDEG